MRCQQEEQRAKTEADEKAAAADAEAERKAAADSEAKAQADAAAKDKADSEAKAKTDAEAKAKADVEAMAKADEEAAASQKAAEEEGAKKVCSSIMPSVIERHMGTCSRVRYDCAIPSCHHSSPCPSMQLSSCYTGKYHGDLPLPRWPCCGAPSQCFSLSSTAKCGRFAPHSAYARNTKYRRL